MVDKKISELPVLSNVTSADLLVIVDTDSNTTYQTTANTFINSLTVPFLPNPDSFEETDTYFYMGWEDVNGGWLIRKQIRSNSSFTDATVANNGAYLTLTAAWASKNTLTYI